jgi:hypothetical protein
MKVPDQTSRTFNLAFDPFEVCGSSGSVEIPLSLGIKDWLLGSEVSVTVRVRGVDEVGRVVSASSY